MPVISPTSRREFLAHLAGAAIPLRCRGFSDLNVAVLGQRGRFAQSPARPTAAQRAWQDLELGLFIHFAPNTWQEQEYDDRSTPLSSIDPDVDTDQWADVAVSLGARYIVFVAKHTGGFCMWQTTSSSYSIRNTPWRNGKGDVVRELSESCRKRELKLGVYLSPRDDHFGAGLGGKCETPGKQATYNQVARQQLTELLTRYGSMVEIWFDGSSIVPVGDILATHARDSMIFQGPHATIRWVGNELGFAPYPAWNSLDVVDARTGVATAMHGDPDGDAWLPLEVDVSIRRPNWFWSTTNQSNLLSLDALVEIYYRSIGRGAQLLLNMPPDRTGRIPEADAARARQFGDEIRTRFGKSVAESSGIGDRIDLALPAQTIIDHVILEEDLASGQPVRVYRLEGLGGDGWMPLGAGLTIGHKRIQPIEPRELRAVRFVSTAHASLPRIRRLAAYRTNKTPPSTWRDSVEIWADDAAGQWQDRAFEIDLSKRVAVAGDYRLRFVPVSAVEAAIEDLQLFISGSARTSLVRSPRDRADVAIITVPEPDRSIVVKGRVRGANHGWVLVRRV